MAEGTAPPECGEEGKFSCFAREFPDLLLENVCSHFSIREHTQWGRCCKTMNAIAQQDLYWARRLSERHWNAEPLPIRGEELLDRWMQSSKAIAEMTTKEIKAELQERNISTDALFERPDFVVALEDARARDLEFSGVSSGSMKAVYKGCVWAEVLRSTMVAMRPMRGMLLRHFVGLNAAWDYGWRERYVEVDDGFFSVYEDPSFLRPIAQVSLREDADDNRICIKVDASQTPDSKAHCFKITNLGVDVVFDARSEALCKAWMDKTLLHALGQDAELGMGGPRWERVGLDRVGAGAMGEFLRRLGLSMHVMRPEHVAAVADEDAGEEDEERRG